MPIDHYENFPVASILLPARLRPAVEAIYRFARSADDIADEGDALAARRLDALQLYETALDRIEHGDTTDFELLVNSLSDAATHAALLRRLQEVVGIYRVPLTPLRDLLSAFKQDVQITRYADYASLLDYCRRSANPVGRLMLHLYAVSDALSLQQSDAICSALQLINFWQDVAIDWQKDRIYIPADDLIRFKISERQIDAANCDDHWRALMQFQVARARLLLLSGAPLALRLPGRIGWELRLVVQGGLRILEKIEAVDYDVFRRRPVLKKIDGARLLWRAISMRSCG